MMIATISTQGVVTVATVHATTDLALDWLVGQLDRFGRVGSLATVETLDGVLLYSVTVPWQMD